MADPIFILNVNAGEDVVHDPAHLTERCNTDQIEGRTKVDVRTAAAMIAKGQARLCEHCDPTVSSYLDEEPTLNTRGPDEETWTAP